LSGRIAGPLRRLSKLVLEAALADVSSELIIVASTLAGVDCHVVIEDSRISLLEVTNTAASKCGSAIN
jgi:hypothetical protein